MDIGDGQKIPDNVRRQRAIYHDALIAFDYAEAF